MNNLTNSLLPPLFLPPPPLSHPPKRSSPHVYEDLYLAYAQEWLTCKISIETVTIIYRCEWKMYFSPSSLNPFLPPPFSPPTPFSPPSLFPSFLPPPSTFPTSSDSPPSVLPLLSPFHLPLLKLRVYSKRLLRSKVFISMHFFIFRATTCEKRS